jgi:hypothetical protein
MGTDIQRENEMSMPPNWSPAGKAEAQRRLDPTAVGALDILAVDIRCRLQRLWRGSTFTLGG